ncbi:hypothetical protein LK09_08260 [Microbacterium mangrovi]|uniref:Uncharacterized protein n=1 Tax=Microbacterium mangrovi TaxID=1348253 RepID=A0A0B2AB59_9MICO|nr:hypothetical protein [Microbacterium mangrovi]KHK98851.1 hypothetical protein LK09_08260 [Microbacterium mangrovi]
MLRPLVGGDPMPASSGLGTSSTSGRRASTSEGRRSDSPGSAADREGSGQDAADRFFRRFRSAKELTQLEGERGDLREPGDPGETEPQASDRERTPARLFDAWTEDCRRARAADAFNRCEITAHEAAARSRAREATRQKHLQEGRDRDARRRADLARVAKWQADNPERARATKERWVQNNLEKRRKASRDYYHRNKEKILAKAKERHLTDPSVQQKRQQKYRQAHPDRIAATSAAWRAKPENKARHREATQRWEARERRRREVGLPPRRIHRRTPDDRRTDAGSADEFFARDWSHVRIPDGPQHRLDPTPPALLDAWESESARARLRHRLRDDPEFRERVERHRNALQDRIHAEQRRAAHRDRVDAIARAVNDRLRIAGPRRRSPTADLAAPNQPQPAPSSSGLGR